MKEKTNGTRVPKSTKMTGCNNNAKSEICAIADHMAVSLVTLFSNAFLFLAIWVVASSLGAYLHYAAENFNWLSPWALKVGHVVENAIYAGDCLSLLVAAGRYVLRELKHSPFPN